MNQTTVWTDREQLVQIPMELENEEGKWQYGVMVRSGKTLREVMVNAMTGKIDSVEVTTAEKERAEKKADADKAKMMPSHMKAHNGSKSGHSEHGGKN